MGSPGNRIAAPEPTPVFLEHYGIRGMKWGIRRSKTQLARANPKKDDDGPEDVTVTTKAGSRVKTSGGRRQSPSDDAITTAILKQKALSSTPDSLSTKELKAVVERMNLEKQYNNLVPDNRPPVQKFISDLMKNDRDKLVSTGDFKQTSTVKIGKAVIDVASSPAAKTAIKAVAGSTKKRKR